MVKKTFLFIFLCVQVIVLAGQTIICSENISKEMICDEEILTAIALYRTKNFSQEDPLLLVDLFREGDLNKYRIYPDDDIWAPIFRQPDCIIIIDPFTIVYLYTPDYQKTKDSSFLSILEQKMSGVFNTLIKYNWKDMTVEVYPERDTYVVIYDPALTEYVFENGVLIETNAILDLKMFYEDLYIPPHYFLRYRVFDPRFVSSPQR
ncbi:MAG: hypothetical protein FWE63_06395 [Bacteroidales bacterium]|nr:hypothetical protein [Bacteroidales bacterium]